MKVDHIETCVIAEQISASIIQSNRMIETKCLSFNQNKEK
jgi:hypothetical protein